MKPTENLIISPLSIANSLALLTQAVNGTTLQEIKTALNITSNQTAIANQFYDLYSWIYKDNYTLSMANCIFLQQNYEINKTFQEIATTKFGANVEHLDFQQPNENERFISQCLVMKTNKTVQNLPSPDAIDRDSKMILVNTINLDNNWLFPFDKECTHYDNFYISENEIVQVEYMCSTPRQVFNPLHGYGYLLDLQATAVELYFGSTVFSLLMILPDNRTGLADLEAKLKDYDIPEIQRHIYNHRSILTVPKFEMEFDIKLQDILKKVIMSLFILTVHSFTQYIFFIVTVECDGNIQS